MGNVIESFASGFGKALGSLFSAPLDFLSGKSCSSICGSTWDVICYIEHFCVANLFKLGLIVLVFYIALFFVYLSYKLRIFHCICHTLCNAVRACFAISFYMWGNICHFLCHKVRSPRRRRHRRMKNTHARDISTDSESSRKDNDNYEESIEESCCQSSVGSQIDGSGGMASHRWREHQSSHLKRSLKPRNHRVQVEISRFGRKQSRHRRRDHLASNVHHHVRVTHTSKFANKRKNRSDKNVVHGNKGQYVNNVQGFLS